MFDLRNFREEVLKLTQKELAGLIDERQDKISRLEKNPDSIGLDILIRIADKTGTTLDELVKYKKKIPEALIIDNTWNSVTAIKKKIDDYVDKTRNNTKTTSKQEYKMNELKKFTETFLKKPKIAIVGLSDTGKSTLINSLLGVEKMPAAWTPTTAITIYIKHKDDRPSYIDDDVWFLKPQLDNGYEWDSNRLSDEKYTREYFCRKGHIQDLYEFAVRTDEDDTTIGSAVVFIDSPILKVCDLIDLPGYNTGDRELDRILTEQVRDYADIMIYMSLANGFMRGNDIEYLKSDLIYLPVFDNEKIENRPLSNLYIVASQAHIVNKGNLVELNKVLDEGAKRLYSQIPKELWNRRSEGTEINYTGESLRNRFFTYSKDIEVLRQPFELDLTTLVEGFSSILIKGYKIALCEFCEVNRLKIKDDINENIEIDHKRNEYIKLSEKLSGNLSQVTLGSQKIGDDVVKNIHVICDDSVSNLSKVYAELVSIDSVINIIDTEDYSNVKGDIEKLGSLLNSKLQEKIHTVIEVGVNKYSKDIDQFLEKYDELINDTSDTEISDINYNYSAKAAFVKGLAGCQSIGANASLKTKSGNSGEDTNFGEGVDILSTMFYTVPGTDQSHTPMGGVAHALALSGVIGLGIGLAMLAVTSGMSVFGTGWKKSVAKKIVAAYNSENVLGTYTDVIEGFWKDTDKAFAYAVDYMEKDFSDGISTFKVKVNQTESAQLEQSIEMDKKLVEFYDGIEKELT